MIETNTHLSLKILKYCFSNERKHKNNNPTREMLISGIAGPEIRENGKMRIKKKEKFVIYLIIYLLSL